MIKNYNYFFNKIDKKDKKKYKILENLNKEMKTIDKKLNFQINSSNDIDFDISEK